MRFISFLLLFVFLYLVNMSTCKKLDYFSTFKFRENVFGEEDLIKDFVTLSNDPKANLPYSFTVCSFVFVKFWTSETCVFEMLKQDGSHWFLVTLSTTMRDYNDFTETMSVWYEHPKTGSHGREDFNNMVPIVPDSWYHICTGVNTDTGMLRIAVNGLMLINEEREYFKNTNAWKPKSVEGSILVFKGFLSGFWYQHLSIFSNLNIFGTLMSVDDMVKRTSGGEDCSSPGEYLRSAKLELYERN